MIERAFTVTGYGSTALMAYGVAALWLHPDSWSAAAAVYVALAVMMLTPVTRVSVACIRYFRAGDRGSALLTLGILGIIALSGWTAWHR